jgi:hydroxymethylbilane synthase
MTFHRALRIGTRGSSLAVTQTGHVVDRLRALGVAVEVETITTRGDLSAPRPVGGLPGDGVFVRELEQALLDGRIDAAVHSLKDLPTAETPGLDLACVPLRAAPFDALVGRAGTTLASLPAGAVVGTSSVRRIVQLRRLRPDLVVRPVRGNVDTRLRNLDAGQYDGLILAAAGLERLGLGDRIVESLEPDAFWPAVGQGALVVQIRTADDRARGLIAPLDDPATHAAVRAERACLAALAGGCLAPIGGWARCDATGRLVLGACVLEETTTGVRRITAEAAEVSGAPAFDAAHAAALGHRVAEQLLRQGAVDMLASMRATGGTTFE